MRKKKCPSCGSEHPEKQMFCDKGHVLTTDPPDDILIGRILDERYQVRSTLGAGGFGMVYLAAQIKLQDRPCVIKVARPELAKDEQFAARFEREKKALMALRSRNSVQIIDYGRTDDHIDYIVMEFIDGMELDQAIRMAGHLDQGRAIQIALGICHSLEEAHGQGILHRDLKPANVMLAELGSSELVKVIDFGIARLADSAEGDFQTRTGEMPGTPAYASYEQLLGQVKLIDHRTDLYALGAIIYEMLTGIAPYGDTVKSTSFDSKTFYYMALAKAKAEVRPTLPSQLHPGGLIDNELDRLVLAMLESTPAKRPSSAKEVRLILERLTRKLQMGATDFDETLVAPDLLSVSQVCITHTEGGMPPSPVADLAVTGVGDMTLQSYAGTATPPVPSPPSTAPPVTVSPQANRGLMWIILGLTMFLVLAAGFVGALWLTGNINLGSRAGDGERVAEPAANEVPAPETAKAPVPDVIEPEVVAPPAIVDIASPPTPSPDVRIVQAPDGVSRSDSRTDQETAADDVQVAPQPVVEVAFSRGSRIVGGKVDERKVDDRLRKEAGELDECFAVVSRENPDAAGKIVLEITILETGAAEAKVLSDDTNDPELAGCATGKIKQWVFPKPTAGPVSFALAFVFGARAGAESDGGFQATAASLAQQVKLEPPADKAEPSKKEKDKRKDDDKQKAVKIRLTVISTPSAEVFVGGRPEGETPTDIVFAKGTKKVKVELRRDKYKSKTLYFRPEKDYVFNWKLEQLEEKKPEGGGDGGTQEQDPLHKRLDFMTDDEEE